MNKEKNKFTSRVQYLYQNLIYIELSHNNVSKNGTEILFWERWRKCRAGRGKMYCLLFNLSVLIQITYQKTYFSTKRRLLNWPPDTATTKRSEAECLRDCFLKDDCDAMNVEGNPEQSTYICHKFRIIPDLWHLHMYDFSASDFYTFYGTEKIIQYRRNKPGKICFSRSRGGRIVWEVTMSNGVLGCDYTAISFIAYWYFITAFVYNNWMLCFKSTV